MKTKSLHFMRKALAMLLLILIGFYGCNNKKNQEEKNLDYQKVKHPEWSKNASIYEVNIRQYTPEGTFNAFAEHLPGLQEMGVDILWLMPIHPIGEKNRKGSMGSYYSVKDYLAINPEFGTEEDFKNLVNQIHKLGMYVIIDWVANHTAWDNQLIFDHP
ncbi:MAG TPA: alpha-amylase family glycosyl hydrolase, partial [Bacteroidales bacterium]|nr:alpha-amylase family glycosyl hydrolase [Bacteroidales bacterium]